ncbi:hypothetical protein JTE90_021784 [Oedothorax gibbosus]|uniref:Endophilin-A n=1 Tax=Oedothorax gibbosus TaxID=931172 RepID=A0AAV6USR6_9ARAC|nr:hypothetical protein JTE90_021784 [Oedothorax gibbosus]
MANLNPFSKVLQKQAGRAKERLLQNFGKADRTTDEDFDLHVKNFNKQQAAVGRLQKEFKNYYQCLKAMQVARRSLMDTVSELYEPCWDGVEEFLHKSDIFNRTFEDFCDNFNIQILSPVSTYMGQFPEITHKISKRNRKLLDYDNCRHNMQNLETMKKKEDTKLAKAKEQLEDARNNFDTLNKELHDELPTLYDSRVEFFATHLQCLFVTESDYHTKDALLCTEIGELLGKLKKGYEEGSFRENTSQLETSADSGVEYFNTKAFPSPISCESRSQANDTKSFKVADSISNGEVKADGDSDVLKAMYAIPFEKIQEASGSTTFSTPTTTIERNASLDIEVVDVKVGSHKEEIVLPREKETGDNKSISEKGGNHVPTVDNAAGDVSPMSLKATAANVLYQVQGTYKYAAEDADELSFDVGDIIDVVEYDDPEEQEEGWLMGIFDGRKGLFPANFTSRI